VNVEKYRAYANQLVRNPDDTEALVNQFAILSERREYGKFYLPIARRAYELAPVEINTAFNYGSALHRAGEFEEALRVYLHCASIADDDWKAKCAHHVGIAYRALDANKRAIEWYTKAHELNGDPQILKDRALAYLADGQLNKGLQEFEIRRETAMIKWAQNRGDLVAQQKLPAGVVHWQGEDLTGKTVVVYHEEGTGDFFQFCRFIPRLREKGVAKILLTGAVPNVLDLVSDNIKVDGIVPLSGPFECDYVIGSMTLPWRCGVELDQVNGKPYFKADPIKLPRRGRLNVGLVWRGNPAYGQDVHRSMAFTEYTPLFDLPGAAFYSLQAGPPGLEVTETGFDGFVANLEPMCSHWRDTARVIQALDVVVSVDTACAHLAGALGKRCFVLVTNAADWRWDRTSEETIWYDSLSVIRQAKQDDWAPCVASVRNHLKGMLRERQAA
jgi:tetratricopeptide (TPR) repeat protein